MITLLIENKLLLSLKNWPSCVLLYSDFKELFEESGEKSAGCSVGEDNGEPLSKRRKTCEGRLTNFNIFKNLFYVFFHAEVEMPNAKNSDHKNEFPSMFLFFYLYFLMFLPCPH